MHVASRTESVGSLVSDESRATVAMLGLRPIFIVALVLASL